MVELIALDYLIEFGLKCLVESDWPLAVALLLALFLKQTVCTSRKR